MCGVAASLQDNLDAAASLLSHRGIRGKTLGKVFHRRLPIVGVSEAYDQPVQTGLWTVAWVGEILNFREIDPAMSCDTELAVSTFVKTMDFRKFDGFWSVVAYNSSDDLIYCMTDYLAQKPLYYRTDMGAVSSEPDATAAFGPVTPDEIYFSAVLKWGYCPEPARTPYNEVKKSLPGERIVLSYSGVMYKSVTDPLVPELVPSNELKKRIEDATRRRVQSSDVPVACLLSGGLDSTVVYNLAKKYSDIRPYYVSDENHELVREIAPNVEEVFWPGSGNVDEDLLYMQEPLDLGSLRPQIKLSKIVREAVCLTGDGADEMFGGYGRSQRYDSQRSDIYHELQCWHLPRLDRVMMRNRVEIRSPFLARDVVNAALALPRDLRTDKKVVRELFKDEIPESIASGKKVPLRSEAFDREARSIQLVGAFRRDTWSSGL